VSVAEQDLRGALDEQRTARRELGRHRLLIDRRADGRCHRAMSSEQARVRVVCPDCGAPLPPEATEHAVRCPQCGNTSAPAPREIRTVVVERVVEAGQDARAASCSSEPKCARCKAKLFAKEVHDIRLFGCGVCGGVFLDNEGSTRITRARDQDLAVLAERARQHAVTAADTRPAGIPCPTCERAMQRVRAAGAIDLDICDAHGTWFDAGELTRVMAAYAQIAQKNGAAEAEARLSALRDQQRAQVAEHETFATGFGAAAGVTAGLLGVMFALSGARSS
jgi:Zn-finger nucleic acid-binding protein